MSSISPEADLFSCSPLEKVPVKGHIPCHVAIIMDGNGRWAKKNNVSTISGHRMGAEAARKIVRYAAEQGISYLTLYAFSAENWLRPPEWVDELMGLLRYYLKSQFRDLAKNGVCLKVIGDRARLPADIVSLIRKAEEKPIKNKKITLVIALSYGGRDEILAATKTLGAQIKSGELQPEDITPERFQEVLYTKDIPDPDLLIRTSGEKRISNFLLWQIAYTEFVFTPTLWPDFSSHEFEEALKTYQQRKRRYGAVIATE